MLLSLYLRREPTTDPILLKYDPTSRHQDVVAYRDAACTVPAVRWSWFHSHRPDRRFKYVNFNCYRWNAIWV